MPVQDRRRKDRELGTGDLGVAVQTADGHRVRGRIAMVASDRLTIAFDPAEAPRASTGSLLKLLFRTIRGAELTATGRLIGQEGGAPGAHHLEFVFEDTPPARQVKEGAPRPKDSNRREAYRVDISPGEVETTLRPIGNPRRSILRQLMDLRVRGSATTVQGWALDMSSEGLCVLVEDNSTHRFEPQDRLQLSLNLPGAPESLDLEATVCHRTSQGQGTRYGLALHLDAAGERQSVQGQILEFVMRQQQRRLRSRVV